jgi:hypothetical protein
MLDHAYERLLRTCWSRPRRESHPVWVVQPARAPAIGDSSPHRSPRPPHPAGRLGRMVTSLLGQPLSESPQVAWPLLPL